MTLRLALAWLHLMALGIGLGAVWARARAAALFSRTASDDTARRVLEADSWWGIAAVLWLATGLWRLFGGTEKGTDYYLANAVFWTKMGLFIVVLLLELAPMITLIRWRIGRGRATSQAAARIATISYVETALVVAIALAAVVMARGLGAR